MGHSGLLGEDITHQTKCQPIPLPVNNKTVRNAFDILTSHLGISASVL